MHGSEEEVSITHHDHRMVKAACSVENTSTGVKNYKSGRRCCCCCAQIKKVFSLGKVEIVQLLVIPSATWAAFTRHPTASNACAQKCLPGISNTSGKHLKRWPRKETHFLVDCVNFALLECIFCTMGAVLTFHGRYWGDCLWCSWAEGEWEEYSRHSHIALYHHHHHHQNHHHRHRHRRHHRHHHHHHHHLVHHHHHPLTRVSGRNIQGTPTLHFICFC